MARRLGHALWLVAPLASLAALVAFWWLLTASGERLRIYPDPATVGNYIGQLMTGDTGLGSTLSHTAATLQRLLGAWVLSMVLGTTLGILAGRYRSLFHFVENLVWIFMATPSIVWVFIIAVAIGVSDLVPILAVTALLTPHILINVAEGTKSIPEDLLDLGRSFRVRLLQRLGDIYIPYLLSYIISSGRAAFALGTKIILLAEVIGLASGIGYVVNYWSDRIFMGPVVAWGLLMTVFGIGVDFLLFQRLEKRMSRWTDRAAAPPTPLAQ